MKRFNLVFCLAFICVSVFCQTGLNRTSYKSAINTALPSASAITAAELRDALNDTLGNNIRFRLDVTDTQVEVGASGTATVDFSGYDRIDLDITGNSAPTGTFDVTITNLEDGDVKYLLVDKTGKSQYITFTGATDFTPDPVAFESTSIVLYELAKKGTSVYAMAFNVTTAATASAKGIVERATTAEAQAGTDGSRYITPSTLRDVTATTTRKGIQENATAAETQTGSSSSLTVTPSTLQDNETWVTATLEAGFGGTIRYRKNNLGNIEITGNFTATATYGIVFYLPAGYRPSFTQYITVYHGEANSDGVFPGNKCTVGTGGSVGSASVIVDGYPYSNSQPNLIHGTIFLTN